jgi:subtilisin-like proprotein convertase family protein
MHRLTRHHCYGAALVALLIATLILSIRKGEPQDSSATRQTSPPGQPATTLSTAEKIQPTPTSRKSRAATQPPRQIHMTHGVELQLALDEAIARQPDGRETSIPLVPPATLATLGDRLATTRSSPVAYPVGKEKSPDNRRVITRDISVNLGDANLAQLLKNHRLTLKERPSYAPGWVILSAADPLAALAVIDAVRTSNGVLEADILVGRPRFKRALPNDTLISQQWHLSNTNSTRTHANVETIWNFPNTGSRGTGIRIGIVDDGIDLTHPDLSPNLDTTNDWDFLQNDNNPSPVAAADDFHGTACAGVAAARGNNNLGVSGVAPNATLVGLRLISDANLTVTDSQESSAMAWRNDIIQIKSNSWGPTDDGSTLITESPGSLTLAAFANATSTGRDGKGTIIVWAGGNGGSTTNRDNSNYDGYANSIHTIAVAASNSVGTRSSYSEPGANLIVCAPSDGTSAQLAITTTDLVGSVGYNTASGTAGNYATDFGGTSSATPVVSGTAALMLEKNPNLGWRDVQEILIRSAFKISPLDPGWSDNSAGFHFNHQFGAGLVDATAAVNLADGWVNLAPQTTVTANTSGLPVAIPDNNPTGITRTFTITDSIRVEHATLRLTASHTNHRNLDITLTSPSGMVSQLAVFDTTKAGESLTNWTFSSVRHWGEGSIGTWTMTIADRDSGITGSLTAAELQLFGTPSTPINQPPQITAASLSETTNAFTDTPLTVSSITATDPESDPISYLYQWQSSTDAITYSNQPITTATLVPNPSNTGKLWRCIITANDGNSNSQPFTTAAVNLLTRPPATASPGDPFTYTSGLVLAGNSANISRQAIINEFSQGPSGTSEWIEILTLQSGSLRFWDLSSNGDQILVFQDTSVWDNIPAGTLIVIYNGQTTKDSRIPADDTNPSDGVMILSSINSTYFDPDYDRWISLGNNGDYFTLNDGDSNRIHGLSYGSVNTESPYIGSVGSAQSAHFNSNQEADADLVSAWTIITQASSTPGTGNNTANSAFVTALRNNTLNTPALFRLGTGITLPAGLSLNTTTGILSGTLSNSITPGSYPITIERYNTTPATVSQSFTLTIADDPTFASWIATFEPIENASATGDPDRDGLPNLVEYALALDPETPENPSPVIYQPGVSSITLTYRVSKLHTDVTLTPEWSTTLDGSQPWSANGITVTVLEDNTTNQLRRAILPIDPLDPQRYLRLRASLTN